MLDKSFIVAPGKEVSVEFLRKISSLVRDRFRALSAFTGFLAGFLLFFDSPNLVGLIAGSFLSASGFLFLAYLAQSLYPENSLKSICVFIFSLILVISLFGVFVYFNYQVILEDVEKVKYNPISGGCEEVQVGGGSRPAWYHEECEGEALERYCERKVKKYEALNYSACIQEPSTVFLG